MRTETAELVLTAARSVMAEVDAGRSVDPLRVQWALQVLAGNAPSPVADRDQSRTHESER